MSLQIRIDSIGGDADVLLAMAENGLQSNVSGGENKGRLLPHSSVARRITTLGRMKKQQLFTAEPGISLEKGWKRNNVSAVVFLQDRSNLRILGAAEIALSSCAD